MHANTLLYIHSGPSSLMILFASASIFMMSWDLDLLAAHITLHGGHLHGFSHYTEITRCYPLAQHEVPPPTHTHKWPLL